jgi:ABC-type antimicrobial peptide transport system permease subunit
MSIAVRTSVDARGVIQPLQRTLRGAAGDQVLYEIQTMDQLADGSIAQQRFLLLLFAVFAGLALVLACIGIYGLLSYVVGRRIPEMGLRLALGATAGGVRRLVLGQSLRLIAVGVVLGTAAALGAGRALARLVSGVQPGGLGTMLAMVAVLVSAALLASYLPAWRASRTDPMHSLRRD